MRLACLLSFLLCCAASAFAQQGKIDGYVTAQYTRTLKDLTKGNNPWGIGSGLQIFWNASPVFRPTAELSGDIYLENDKVLRLGPADEAMPTVGSISRLLVGPSVQFGRSVNIALSAGPSFTDGEIYFTLKPALHIFLNNKQSTFVKIAYIYVNNRGNTITEDFISYALGLGFRIF